MKKIIIVIISVCFMSLSTTAQNIDIPEDVTLKVAEDYQKYESLVLESINWLSETPINLNPSKRKEVNTFLMKWMTGSPTVSISLVEGLVPLDCPDCLMAFLSGWTKYSLENNYSDDKVKCAIAGIENAINLYNKNKSTIGKNSDLEKLIKKMNSGKLEKYVESKF
jgi:hypothetical protein